MLRAFRDYSAKAEIWARAYFAKGLWRRLVWKLFANLVEHNATRTASAMAFDLFLAFVPMLALAGWVVAHVLKASEGALASGSVLFDVTPSQMHTLLARHFQRLEATSLAPLASISGWWLASSAFHTLIGVYEDAFKIDPRPWYKTRVIALVCALLAICALSLSGTVGLIVAAGTGNPVARLLLAPVGALGLGKWLGTGAALIVATAFFSLLFQVSVRRKRNIRRHVVPGAMVAVILGALCTVAFGYYASQLGRFAVFYGGLAAVAITMAWLWLWCISTLLGVEVNVLIENLDRDRELPPEQRLSNFL
jgi:membrane protein